MIQWLQSHYTELIAHHVLSEHSADFLQRFGFADVCPPIPEAKQAEVHRFVQEKRQTFEAAQRAFGTPHTTPKRFDEDGRQRMMVWPASAAHEPERIAAQLSSAGLTWWYVARSHRSSRTPEEHRRRADFIERAFGWDTRSYLRSHGLTSDSSTPSEHAPLE